MGKELWIFLSVLLVLIVLYLIVGNPFGKDKVIELDDEVQQEIDKLFFDESKKIVIYPSSGRFSLEKKSAGGIAFSIKNVKLEESNFEYDIEAKSFVGECQLTLEDATNLISLGKSGTNIFLGPGEAMIHSTIVKLRIPEDSLDCEIIYEIKVLSEGVPYDSVDFSLEII